MKINLLVMSALFVSGSLSAEQNREITPRLREHNEYTLPNKFRQAGDEGITASAQFAEQELKYLIDTSLNKNLIVLDFRREFHGFVNGYPVSWKIDAKDKYGYNQGLSSGEIEERESALLAEFPLNRTVEFRTDTSTRSLHIESVASERQIVEKMGARYLRVPVGDSEFPTEGEFEFFVQFIRTLTPDTAIHVHSAGGEGRTTVFLAMIDMMRNHKTMSFEEILKRQEAIGGVNLYDPELRYAEFPERLEGAHRRLEFLRDFYNSCREGL